MERSPAPANGRRSSVGRVQMGKNRDLARGRALALRIMDGLDEELEAMEGRTGGPLAAARALRDDWREGEPGDLFLMGWEIENFTAELAVARAGIDGPDARPCPFDPCHESAGTRALWRPAGLAPRPVWCCADDAAQITAGLAPSARLVPSLAGMVALWEGDDLNAHWLCGHHAVVGTAGLREVFQGLPLGHWLARRGR